VTKEKGRESNDLLLLTAITIEPLTLGDDSSDTRNCTCEYVAIRPGIAQENLMGEELLWISVHKNALLQVNYSTARGCDFQRSSLCMLRV
jgi:hypothetical protein